MLDKKTVIVLGAGASAEFGLPVGAGLAQNISNALHFEDINNISFSGRGGRLLNAVQQNGGRQMLLAAQAISKGVILSSSIDSFLDNHKCDTDIVTVGKMAIIDQISHAENSSLLYYSNSNAHYRINFNRLINSWLLKLYRLISAKVSADSVCNIFDNLTIINFNYDRCVEQFLICALEVNYRIDYRMASDIVRSLKIIRPYGSIGDIFNATPSRSFGSRDAGVLSDINRIRIYTESIKIDEDKSKINQAFTDAGCVIFLGFAFHQQNVDLLFPNPVKNSKANVYATMLNSSNSDLNVVESILKNHFSFNILVENSTCERLISDYSRSISS